VQLEDDVHVTLAAAVQLIDTYSPAEHVPQTAHMRSEVLVGATVSNSPTAHDASASRHTVSLEVVHGTSSYCSVEHRVQGVHTRSENGEPAHPTANKGKCSCEFNEGGGVLCCGGSS